jgi:D-alanine--poly(phosphoribitol) ligase subunit 1
LTEQLAAQLLPRCRALWNVYGPTETTIWATAARVERTGPDGRIDVSLGQALSDRHDLVDGDGTLVTAPGVEGEIVISGECVAIGYLGDTPEQRRFTTVAGIPERSYLTGDRGRYRADGSLEFLGHRLELAEVEVVLESHPMVRQAVVLLCHGGDHAREHLAAAVSTGKPLGERRLREWLAERLPAYMVPQRISIRPALPNTSTGKVDRTALRTVLENASR